MLTRAKNSAPAQFWIDVLAELQALLTEEDPRKNEYAGLLQYSGGLQFIDVPTFCNGEQPTWHDVTLQDLLDDTWLEQMKNCAASAVFYRFCEEIIEMLLDASVTLTAEELKASPVSGKEIYLTDGQAGSPVPLFAVFSFDNANGVFDTGGDFELQSSSDNAVYLSCASDFCKTTGQLSVLKLLNRADPLYLPPLSNAFHLDWSSAFTGDGGNVKVKVFYIRVEA
jgi:hypothetical protein